MSPFRIGLVGVAAAAVLFAVFAGVAKNQVPKVRTAPSLVTGYQIDDTWHGGHAYQPPVYLPAVEKNGMKMQVEMSSRAEADSITIHVSEQLTGHIIERWEGSLERPDNPQPPLVRELFAIKGISEVALYPYRIVLSKGHTFSWDEMKPAMAEVVFRNLGKPIGKKASGGSILRGNQF